VSTDGNPPQSDHLARQRRDRAYGLLQHALQLSEGEVSNATSKLTDIYSAAAEHSDALTDISERLHRSVGGKKQTLGDLVFNQVEQFGDFREFITRVDEQLVEQIDTTEQVGTTLNDIATLDDAIEQLSHRSQYLSLNAMIEAARLGDEVGRGFMVIAQDMRELNQEIEETATRIGALVETLLRVLPELRRGAQNIHNDTDAMVQTVHLNGGRRGTRKRLAGDRAQQLGRHHVGDTDGRPRGWRSRHARIAGVQLTNRPGSTA
jgi:methyl-accepting chemotaxis protein